MKEEKFFQDPLNFSEIKDKTEKYILNTYRRAPVSFYFGQGEYLYDTEQKKYLDFLSGIAVTGLGHGEADIVEAIREQAERLIHTSNLFYNEQQALLAEVLISHSFPGKVFFCNSGTEANEAAFKLSRSFGQRNKNGAFGIISLQGSFHGRTTAGMSLTGQDKIHSGFGPLLPGIKYLPPNEIEIMEKELSENSGGICAIFLELIQGEGGVNPLEKEYVADVRKLASEHNTLLVIDEVQTGIGRTGELFAFEQYDIEPDILTLAKGLGNGFPMGAMIVSDEFADNLGPGMHGSTFGGNHLASKVAYETIRVIMTREILQNVKAVSEFMFRRLNAMKLQHSVIHEVRGIGFLVGIELTQPGASVVESCRNAGLLLNCTAENTLRLMPPLNITLERVAEGLDILEKVLSEMK